MNILNKLTKYFLKVNQRSVCIQCNDSPIYIPFLTQEKYQQANQRIADLENIVAIYEEKEKAR